MYCIVLIFYITLHRDSKEGESGTPCRRPQKLKKQPTKN